MSNFFTWRSIVVVILFLLVSLICAFAFVLINKQFFQPTLFNLSTAQQERSVEEIKALEQNLNILKENGICVKCDLGWRVGESEERRELRDVIKLIRSKGLPIDLSQSNLLRANLSGANLSGANLSGAFLLGADLTLADLTGADLTGASLAAANLSGANLTGANLHGAELVQTQVINANFTQADLTDAILYFSMYNGVIFADADLRGAMIWKDLSNTDLTNAKLDSSFKRFVIKWSFYLKQWWNGWR